MARCKEAGQQTGHRGGGRRMRRGVLKRKLRPPPYQPAYLPPDLVLDKREEKGRKGGRRGVLKASPLPACLPPPMIKSLEGTLNYSLYCPHGGGGGVRGCAVMHFMGEYSHSQPGGKEPRLPWYVFMRHVATTTTFCDLCFSFISFPVYIH